MSATEAERLAVLETEMKDVRRDVADIKASLKSLEAIASKGGGALHAILMLGGLIGWLVGIVGAVYAMAHR